jgi:hypothetical protein
MRWPAAAILIVYALALLSTLEDFRVVMGDEAAYIDPAVRWCSGKGFTSTAWRQPASSFWAENFPLYAVVNAAWIQFTGASTLWEFRALSVLLYAGGLWLWIVACCRTSWMRGRWQQAGFLALILGSLYATSPSQYIRPEALAPLLLGFAVWGQTLRRDSARNAAAALTGLAAVLAGLQFAVCIAAWGLIYLVSTGRRAHSCVVWYAIGGAAGFAALVALYAHNGVLGVFLASTLGQGGNRAAQWQGWRDPMLWASTLVLAGALRWGGLSMPKRLWAQAGLAAGPGVALLLFSLSKYPQYYGFLTILPLCTATATVVSSLTRPHRRLAIVVLTLAGLAGFPLSALNNWNLIPSRNHAAVVRWVESHLPAETTAFVDPSAYFASIGRQRDIYTQFALLSLTDEKLSSIGTIIVMPDHPLSYLQREVVLKRLGGRWELVAVFPESQSPPRIPALTFLSRLSYAPVYRFETWRRTPEDPPP